MDEDEMTAADWQAHLDGMTAVMTGMTQMFEDERRTTGGLSDASQLALVALRLAAAKTELALIERGVSLRTGEGAA